MGTEQEQAVEAQQATVKVGLIIEIPVETKASDDSEFISELQANKDISEAISQLVFSALAYRDSAPERASHKVMYSKFVIFYDESSGQPIKLTWGDL